HAVLSALRDRHGWAPLEEGGKLIGLEKDGLKRATPQEEGGAAASDDVAPTMASMGSGANTVRGAHDDDALAKARALYAQAMGRAPQQGAPGFIAKTAARMRGEAEPVAVTQPVAYTEKPTAPKHAVTVDALLRAARRYRGETPSKPEPTRGSSSFLPALPRSEVFSDNEHFAPVAAQPIEDVSVSGFVAPQPAKQQTAPVPQETVLIETVIGFAPGHLQPSDQDLDELRTMTDLLPPGRTYNAVLVAGSKHPTGSDTPELLSQVARQRALAVAALLPGEIGEFVISLDATAPAGTVQISVKR
ncbi:MAG: hypothetical protein AAF220_09150, partial [Pseudomonadota bacterium]